MKQRSTNDCGIAALAMLFGTTYKAMRALVLSQAKKAQEKFDGTTEQYAINIGRILGDKITVQRVQKVGRRIVARRIKDRPAILVVPAKDSSTDYHAVYWSGKELYDPSPRNPYGRNGLKAFDVFIEAWTKASDK